METRGRFIGEAITVAFDKPPMLSKKPHCPNQFTWDSTAIRVVELLGEWRDYERRGRRASNMRPEHASRAAMRGSWGVGRYFFRVKVEDGRVFDLVYDRAPKDADDRMGSWFLYREVLDY